MLADLCPCFHRLPTKLCLDLVALACWIVTEFLSFTRKSVRLGRSRSKLCPILCRLRTKLCPDFGRSRARLCPIYFAPCPFPNRESCALRYTAVVDHYVPNIAACLRDPSPLVRKQTLIVLTRLLQVGTTHWEN